MSGYSGSIDNLLWIYEFPRTRVQTQDGGINNQYVSWTKLGYGFHETLRRSLAFHQIYALRNSSLQGFYNFHSNEIVSSKGVPDSDNSHSAGIAQPFLQVAFDVTGFSLTGGHSLPT